MLAGNWALRMKKVLIVAGTVLVWAAGCGPADPQQRVNAGAEALAGGDISRGVMLLERVAQELPRDTRALNLYGQALYLFGKPADAAKVFWQAIEANPGDPAPHYNLGLAAYVERDYPTAAEQLEASVALDARNVPAWLFLGATYLHLNNLDAAYRATRTALEVEPQNPDARNNLAVIAYRRGRTRDAEAWLAEALRLAPDYSPACLNLARLYETALQDKAQALEFYRRYARMSPESPHRFAVTGATRRLELDLNLASPGAPVTPAAAATTNTATTPRPPSLPTATNLPAAAAAPAPMPPDLQAATLRIQIDQLAGVHRNREAAEAALRLAEVYRLQNDMNRIGDAYTRAAELDPLNPAAHFRLGDYLQHQGQKAAALQSYQEAARLQPQMTDAARRIAALAEELGQAPVAAAACKRVIELAPDDRPAYLRLAEIQEKHLQQRAGAQQTYQTFLRKFPTAPEANQVRGRLGLKAAAAAKPEAKKTAAAKPPVEKPAATTTPAASALPAPPPPPSKSLDVAAAYKDALNLLHQGDFDGAQPSLEAIVRASPGHAQAHLALAQVYSMRAETKEKARAHYIRFLQLRPDDAKALDVRRWLDATR